MPKKYKIATIIFILTLGIFIYTHNAMHWFNQSAKSSVVTVTVQQVMQKDVSIYIDSIGTVEAYATVNVKSLVDGQVVKVAFTQGQMVQQGQLLYRIDPRPYDIALQQAQANLVKDQAQQHSAQLTLKRYAKLIKPGYVSKQDYDSYQANADALAATVKADQAAVANAQLQLSYTNITAPISGRAGDILVKAGNLVKSAEGTTLVTLNQINPIYISFTLPQQYFGVLQQPAKTPLAVTARVGNESLIKGQISFINNTIDTATGSLQLKATFSNNEYLLWPGQFANVSLASAFIKNALIIPTSALQMGQKGTYVYVIRQDKAYYQPVSIGATVKEGILIKAGLAAGDQVVVDGQFLLTDGAPVKTVVKT